MKNGRSVDSSFGFTALDGLCMGTRPGALDPGVVLYLFQSLGLSVAGGREHPLQEIGPARHLGHQQRHARSARPQVARSATRGRLLRLSRRSRRSARSRRRSVESTGWCSRPASARTPRRSANGSATRRCLARDRAGRGRECEACPANFTRDQSRLGVGDSDERRTDDRASHRVAPRARRGERHGGRARRSVRRTPGELRHPTWRPDGGSRWTETRRRRRSRIGRARRSPSTRSRRAARWRRCATSGRAASSRTSGAPFPRSPRCSRRRAPPARSTARCRRARSRPPSPRRRACC